MQNVHTSLMLKAAPPPSNSNNQCIQVAALNSSKKYGNLCLI